MDFYHEQYLRELDLQGRLYHPPEINDTLPSIVSRALNEFLLAECDRATNYEYGAGFEQELDEHSTFWAKGLQQHMNQIVTRRMAWYDAINHEHKVPNLDIMFVMGPRKGIERLHRNILSSGIPVTHHTLGGSDD